jgi:hypothetical protein
MPERSIHASAAHVTPLVSETSPFDLPTKRDMVVQALLHLPRVAAPDGTVELSVAMEEITRIRDRRSHELVPFASMAQRPERPLALHELSIGKLDPQQARPVMEHFHYLRSARDDSLTIGALYAQRVVALCSVSPLDLPWIAAALPIAPENVAVLSRVFAFDWAPRNTISYLLSQVEHRIRRLDSDTKVLITYLNPNLGFSGASYRAANWLPLGEEGGTRYAYLDGEYITDRRLRMRPPRERSRAEYSRMALEPLRLLCRPIDKHLQRSYPDGFDFTFEGPERSVGPPE